MTKVAGPGIPLVGVPTLEEIVRNPEVVTTLPRATVVTLLVECAVRQSRWVAVQGALTTRLLATAGEPAVPVPSTPAEPAPEGPEWLTAEEAVALGVPRRWLTDKARWLAREGVVCRLGHKTVRYHRARLLALLDREARTAQIHAQRGRP